MIQPIRFGDVLMRAFQGVGAIGLIMGLMVTIFFIIFLLGWLG
jgi:hypothetical protein